MVAFELSIAGRDLARRMRDRLRGAAPATARSVIWQDAAGQRVLIHHTTLAVRLVDGWLLCDLDVETDQTGRQRLQFVFFAGRPGDDAGPQAGGTINAPALTAARLAGAWGAELQRVLWDGVLDAIEACVHRADEQHRQREPITLSGFHVRDDVFGVSVLVGRI
jgi:hypothetical protein